MLPFHVLRALHEVMNSLVEPDIDCDISILVVWIDYVLIIVWHFALLCLLGVQILGILSNPLHIEEQREDLLNEKERVIKTKPCSWLHQLVVKLRGAVLAFDLALIVCFTILVLDEELLIFGSNEEVCF